MTETTRSSADPLDIAVIGGDGIGPEVTDQAAAVLQAALRAEGRPEARL
ncbi:MAG TPA: 3-isopropylmalate dehydrogenase, partial [Micrococcus luteus]|nr:3-isopropylmalate dehydrogenase [Micrococcus luteus]